MPLMNDSRSANGLTLPEPVIVTAWPSSAPPGPSDVRYALLPSVPKTAVRLVSPWCMVRSCSPITTGSPSICRLADGRPVTIRCAEPVASEYCRTEPLWPRQNGRPRSAVPHGSPPLARNQSPASAARTRCWSASYTTPRGACSPVATTSMVLVTPLPEAVGAAIAPLAGSRDAPSPSAASAANRICLRTILTCYLPIDRSSRADAPYSDDLGADTTNCAITDAIR